jgi:hypothetical protein
MALAACATLPATGLDTAAAVADATVTTKPADVASTTVLDEQAALGVELAYKAFRTALEVATDAGVLRGTAATQAADLDARAYLAVLAVRGAYRSGNATSYGQAVTDARAAITAALASVKG